MSHDLSAVCRADADTMNVVKMVMALPHLPAQRGPPHSDRVLHFSIGDGLDANIDYLNEGEMDARLQNLTVYVRRFWLGVDSLSTFGSTRRTNNDLRVIPRQTSLCVWPESRHMELHKLIVMVEGGCRMQSAHALEANSNATTSPH